jgi:hypothetical protein
MGIHKPTLCGKLNVLETVLCFGLQILKSRTGRGLDQFVDVNKMVWEWKEVA